MKKIYFLLTISLSIIASHLCAQNENGYFATGDYVTISFATGDGTRYYLEASSSGLLTKNVPTDQCLWIWDKHSNGDSYYYTLQDLTTKKFLGILDYGNNTYALTLKDVETAFVVSEVNNEVTTDSYLCGQLSYMYQIVHNQWYTENRNVYVMYEWVNGAPLFKTNTWGNQIDIEKWEQKGAGMPTAHFSPSKQEYTYVKDDQGAKEQTTPVTFRIEATTESYYQCVNRPNEALLNRQTMMVDPNDVQLTRLYWKSKEADEENDKVSTLDVSKFVNCTETNGRSIMTLSDMTAHGDNAWQFSIIPNGKSPMGLKDKLNTLERWIDYADNVVVEYTYKGVKNTQEMRVVRKSYHEETIPPLTFSISPVTYTFAEKAEEVTINVVPTHQHGTAIYNVDNQVVESHADDPEQIKLNTAGWSLSFNFSDNGGEWMTAALDGDYKIKISAQANNAQDANKRSSLLTGTFVNNSDSQHPHSGSFSIPLHQRFKTGGITFHTQKGEGNVEWHEGDEQQVHTSQRTIYYRPNDDIELRLPEAGYSGYMRWYDYTTKGDPFYNDRHGDEYPSTSWVLSPRAANGNAFSAINTPQSKETVGEEGFSYGLYAINKADGGVLDEDNPDNPAPILKGWSDGEYHIMACDVSAYTDYVIAQTQGQITDITEPTLSYRQLFHLRPAAEIADKFENLAADSYLEEYHYQAPAGKQVLLSTEYRYKKYRSHISEMCYFYEGTDEKLHRVDDTTPISWKVDGDILSPNYTAELDYLIVRSDDYPARKIYTLTAHPANYEGELRIARFVVDFVDVEKHGPTQKTIITNQRITNEFKRLGEINFDTYQGHLPWHYTTYGYVYDGKLGNQGGEFKRGASQGQFPFYGEYLLLENVNKDWAKGSARSGKALYVDGTMEPGLVATISTDAIICSGQTMYCSAWFCNPAPAGWSGEGNPIFRCNVQGKKKDINGIWGDWENAGVYFVGELIKNSGWQQIFFPIESAHSYDSTRVSIYNFATTNQGNDFMVDDINLFVSQLPIAAYQGKMACRSIDAEHTNAAAVLRLDYSNINAGSDGYMYYQIYNETFTSATVPSDPDTIGGFPVSLTGEAAYYHDYDADHEIDDHSHPYGSVHIPVADFDPETYNATMKSEGKDTVLIYQSVSKILDDMVLKGLRNAKAYVKTQNNGVTKWLMYVLHIVDNVTEVDVTTNPLLPLQRLYDKHVYSMRMAYTPEELATPDCNMQTPLHATQQTVFQLTNSDGEIIKHIQNDKILIASKENEATLDKIFDNSTQNCANDLYFLKAMVVNHLAVNTGDNPGNLEAPIYADWLVCYDHELYEAMESTTLSQAQKEELFKEKYKYTPGQVTTAIMYDMRRIPSADEPNPNYPIRNFKLLDRNAFLSQQNYEIVKHLHDNGWLHMCDTSVHFYLSANETAAYWAFPIAETAKAYIIDGDTRVEVTLKDCNEPRWITVAAASSAYHLNITPLLQAQKNFQQKMQIPAVKVVAGTTNIDLPIKEMANGRIHIGGTAPSDNLSIDLANLPGYISFYDLETEKPISAPSSLNMGEEYTIRMAFQNENNYDKIGNVDDACRVGYVFFTLQVVPNVLVWQPAGTSFNGWGLDENWKGWDDKDDDFVIDDGELTNGFVPMKGTDVVIPDLGNPLLYPYIVPEHDHDHYPMTVHNDQHRCKDIYFAAGAHIQNQNLLEYEKAFVDMSITPGTWNTMAAPLHDMYSGDMFIPHEGWWDNINAKRETLNPFETEAFQGIRHADAAYAFWQAFYNETVILHHENNGKTIVSPTADFTQSNTMSQALKVGEGFNLKGYGPGNPQVESSLVIRLPKKDDKYYYYSNSGVLTNQTTETLSRTKANKLAFEPTDGTMIITLDNETEGTEFLLGNPTMAYIDMSRFLADNSDVLHPTFRYMRDNVWYGAHSEVPAQSEDKFLPPMRSALVQAKSPATQLSLSLKTEHLTLNNYIYALAQQEEPANMPRRMKAAGMENKEAEVMTICAITNNAYARSVLAVKPNADDDFKTGEDASFISSGVETPNLVTTPLNLYTLSEQMPMMVDIRKNIDSIPLALLTKDSYKRKTIQFAFYLSSNWTRVCYFCDRVTGARYRIMDGVVLNLPMSDSYETRYFIQGPDEADDEEKDDELSSIENPFFANNESSHMWVYTPEPELLSIITTLNMKSIKIYDVAGRTVGEQSFTVDCTQTSFRLPMGMYVLEVKLENNEVRHLKALVK